jgi:hypothetical protein
MKQGFLGALVVAGIMFGAYLFSKELYLNTAVNWLILLVYVPFMWWSIQEFAKGVPANLDFRTFLRPPFLTFVLINLGFYLLMYGLFLSDSELLQITAQREIQFFESELAAGTGDPTRSNELREKINYLRTNGMQMPLGHLLLQMCLGAMGGFGLSAILVFMHQSRSK